MSVNTFSKRTEVDLTNIVSSSIKALLQINGVRHLFSGEILVQIINSLVFSKLYYCSSVWASTSATNVKKIQCVQNFAARVITGTYKYEHITPSLKALKWLPVTKELYLREAVMTFKCINGFAPPYLCQNFCKRRLISGRSIKQSNDIQISKCRTTTGQRSFTYRAIKIWNTLCSSLKQSASIDDFKRRLKKQHLECLLDPN